MDKAGKKYWNGAWSKAETPLPIDIHDRQTRNYDNRRFHEYFCMIFSGKNTQGLKLLEIGCAKSRWLPYFAAEFGFLVSGLDYSEVGCQMARQVLADSCVNGEIVLADMFAPPVELIGAFDVVVSFGVAEHFEDTAKCISAMSQFLKPSGLLFTNIPNMIGLIGLLQKLVNRPVYDIHVLIDKKELAHAHAVSGCEVLECDYFLSTSFGICNLIGIPRDSIAWMIKKSILGVLARLSMIMWFIEDRFGHFRSNRWTSPYVNCIARKL